MTVVDDEDPTISCPSDLTGVSVDAGQCSAVVSYTAPTGSDNCAGANTVQTAGLPSGSAFPVGTTTNTFVVTDAAGNTATCSFDVTVVDDEDPTINNCPSNIVISNNPGLCSAVVNWTEPIADDNCTAAGSLVWTKSHLPGATFPVGTTTVTYEVMDTFGNTSSCSFTVTVNDNENPTITCPSNMTVGNDPGECGANVTYSVPFSDNCSGSTISQTSGIASGGFFTIGTTTNSFTVTDAAGNTSSCSFTVTVNDTQVPTITCPADINVNNDPGLCSSNVSFSTPTGADNCGVASVSQISGPTSGSAFPVGTTAVTFRVTDTAGLTTDCSFNVTVIDNENPVTPSIPDLSDECSVTVSAPTTTDNCAGTITGTNGDYSFPHTFNREGTYVITWLFDDGNGNSFTIDQTVTIDDVTAPVPDLANLPDINVVDCEVDVTVPTADDNCRGTINGVPTDSNGNDIDFPITKFGTTIITWTYDDRNGQSVTQQQSVTLTKPPISGGFLLGQIDDLDPVEFPPSNNVLITACPDNINPVTINLDGENGTIVQWEKFEAGSTKWDIIPNTAGLQTYHIEFDFSSSLSAVYRVLIQWGTCEEYSQVMSVHAVPPDVPPLLEENYFNTCFPLEVSLTAYSGYGGDLIDPEEEEAGQFDQGQFPDKWNPNMWKIDGQVAGVAFTGAANNRSVNNWTATNNHPFPDGTWTPKIEYDSNNFKFAIAQGDYTSQEYIDAFPPGNATTLETPIMSLLGLESPTFSFTQAWNLFPGDTAICELSLDGGLTYSIVLEDLTNPIVPWNWSAYPPSTASNYIFDQSIASFDLSAYNSNDQVRIRWTFFGTSPFSAWAIDEITLPLGGSPADEIEWTDGIGDPNEAPLADGSLNVTYTFTPDAPGHHQYGATVLVNGCRAYDPDGTALADVIQNYAYAGEDILYADGECGENIVILNAYDNTKTAFENEAKGAYETPANCKNCDDPGTMTPGKWTVVNVNSTCGGSYSFSNVNDPDATFTGDPGIYTLRWTVGPFGLNNDGYCSADVQIQITNCSRVDFDGINDHVTFNNNYDLPSDFSLECWIKPDATTNVGGANNTIQTIISKRDANNLNKGYDLRLEGNKIFFKWDGSGSISSPSLGTNRWYHVAVTRINSGKNYNLYIDGILVANTTGNPPSSNTNAFILGAMAQSGNPPNKPVNYFSGWIDEVRIWNKALSVDHIRQMMNQQIDNSSGNVIGDVIPMIVRGSDTDVNGIDDNPITWANLMGYYRMDPSSISCGYLQPYAGKGFAGKLMNITTPQDDSAPLPYTTKANGNWYDTSASTPWTYGNTVWDYPNALGVNGSRIDWNIVKTSHNVESDLTSANPRNITLLGLIVDTSSDLTITAQGTQDETNKGHGLWLTHYLKLDGFMDLVGESQLVQKRYTTSQYSESILDVASGGFLKRDQQGTTNLFNYNYWSPLVGEINTSANNINYRLTYNLEDGTISSNPQTLLWTTNRDAPGTTNPITISSRWIYTYANRPSNTYSEWQYIGDTGTITAGLGYTMKGSGVGDPITDVQNYSFVGKPNNGTISNLVSPGNDILVGNPYPSAIDAEAFINENGPSGTKSLKDGALYFWDHYYNNDTHILRDYLGGYAVRNLIGGVAAITPPITTDLYVITGGNGTKIPGRYVPVAQGFFVTASTTGGQVTFRNSQRVFQRETNDNSNNGSQFFRYNGDNSSKEKTKNPDSGNYIAKLLRLEFTTTEGAKRPLLLGFVPDGKATDGVDYGYDAINYDTFPCDLSWRIENQNYVIQGVGDFDKTKKYPLYIFITETGKIEINLAELENFDHPVNVYVFDALLDTYTKINNKSFKMNLNEGEYQNRFYIAFTKAQNARLDIEEAQIENSIVNYLNKSNEIYIYVPNSIEVKEVYLSNLLGQTIKSWKASEIPIKANNEFRIPVENISEGYYIVKVETNSGPLNKKIIIKFN